ncbi:hypothetical protein JXZ92_02025 [Mycoplasma sp. CSL10137]|uniref:hypothetical protein n=1 Tax=unclassified Mycoplasma TaxID=2683645 RepID=UPI00197B39C7|nr:MULTISPECIES: hypothetical protein [unclassified Mycoplasma]MBN4083597.1 hypothetical protein [Mycoplasma sp. CSL10137]MBN4084122.1 hypothetical protein [Mycoplasma sp. CSL10166]MCU4706564.1 hypothetical protein [Mycoplasma sp. CSL7503-lung]
MKFLEHFKNYKERKILLFLITLLVFISLIFQIVMYINFFDRIEIEKNWINAGHVLVLNWKKASPTYQLTELFLFLNTLFVFSAVIILIILFIMQYKLYKNIGNADEYFKSLYFLVTVLFVSAFAIISLQPESVNQINVITINNELREVNNTLSYDLSYKLIWSSMFMSFIALVFTISAKKKFGFVTKDKILMPSINGKDNRLKMFLGKKTTTLPMSRSDKITDLKNKIQDVLDNK